MLTHACGKMPGCFADITGITARTCKLVDNTRTKPAFFESAIASRESEIILLIFTLPRFMYIPLLLTVSLQYVNPIRAFCRKDGIWAVIRSILKGEILTYLQDLFKS